ncbi:mitochondrial ribosomal protein [Coniella lustricola]|uniref:Small ribosomal subunit protein mS29 n=1 Tax=Coniella lustricola TaxID=2025994 RepID=A0A2T3A4L5_9PEZI|nr:mitochondrial ribosomal protein [Coniella lustricola]
MASPSCWRCLLRPSTAATPSPFPARHFTPLGLTTTTTTTKTILPATATTSITATPSAAHSFSTSTPSYAGGRPGVHQRLGKRMQLSKFKKKKEIMRPKAPKPGERKAFRKRIVLSNNNALPVRGLELMSPARLASQESAGHVLKIPDHLIDRLRAVEAFKSSQTWEFFHSPHMLVRPETVHICERMGESVKDGSTARIVVSGGKAAGKSMTLLQAQIYAFMEKWVVINIPEAQELTTAATDYAPIPDTDPQLWMQSSYALKFMQAILAGNRAVLEKVYTTRSYEDFTNPVAEGATLVTLIESAHEVDQAWSVFAAFWHELFIVKADSAGTPRPPILFSADGLASFMRTSDYRNQTFEPIHSHDLAIVRNFVDVLSGKTPLPSGGAVIGATCRSNAARNPSMELAINRQLARQQGPEAEMPQRDPYGRKYDERVDAVMENTGIEVVNVQGISKAEARSLLEYWAASGMMRAQINETTVSEKWMTGGNGIIGEMERAGLTCLRI